MPGGPTMLQTLRSAFCVALSFMGGVAKVRFRPIADLRPTFKMLRCSQSIRTLTQARSVTTPSSATCYRNRNMV